MPLTRLFKSFAATLAVAGLLGTATLSAEAADPAAQPAAEAPAPAIRVVAASRQQIRDTLPVNGTVVPREEAAVGVDVNGLKVLELRADQGDEVKQGQVLAILDKSGLELTLLQSKAQRAQIDAQAAQAKAQISDAEVGVRQAQETLDRVDALRKKGVASQAQYDNAVNGLDSARAKLETARKAVVAAEAQIGVNEAQVRELQRQIARTEVKSPANGLVLARNAMLGAVVGASAGPLFRIAIDNDLELQATVSETHLPRLKAGQAVSVRAPGVDKPLEGTIRMVAPEVSKATRLGTVFITLPAGSPVRAGNFASASIELVSKQALVLPASAVLFRNGEPYVQKVVDGKVASTPVSLGIRVDGIVEVTGGVAEGDQVVSRAGVFVNDGDAITPVLDEATGAIAQ
ncbi:efflux transporter periplasmic adaptor subunit [Zhengella mangrovi]|uniref:Efflux transporter periplasmic adaptor subunit n=1 Tax=Zhengella mangrovi TaxID=1982044 RepID=A0A2G1QNW4_9HYPH|nr:efflux RND transporter periplasmic adaptor subunit [Zhengella mangrovi]PHP66908.1 efflux transporter periplasmic adaptor subunit [Zhengella mangrovi]